ncbi:hypothetical protein BH18ACT15_BH18ACT15_10200 [soil metagenome]
MRAGTLLFSRRAILLVSILASMCLLALGGASKALAVSAQEPNPHCTSGPVSLYKSGGRLHAHNRVSCNSGVDKVRLALFIKQYRGLGYWRTKAQHGKTYHNWSSGWKSYDIRVSWECSGGNQLYKADRVAVLYDYSKKYDFYFLIATYGKSSAEKRFTCN